jgi:hypothetical protein
VFCSLLRPVDGQKKEILTYKKLFPKQLPKRFLPRVVRPKEVILLAAIADKNK